MYITAANASLHCIKHHLKKAASQSTRSTHHRDRLSHVELAASGWRQALQLREAMIVLPMVVSNSAYHSKQPPSAVPSTSDNSDTNQG